MPFKKAFKRAFKTGNAYAGVGPRCLSAPQSQSLFPRATQCGQHYSPALAHTPVHASHSLRTQAARWGRTSRTTKAVKRNRGPVRFAPPMRTTHHSPLTTRRICFQGALEVGVPASAGNHLGASAPLLNFIGGCHRPSPRRLWRGPGKTGVPARCLKGCQRSVWSGKKPMPVKTGRQPNCERIYC